MHKPDLKSTQFALMVVDGFTGHVLNTNLQVYISDGSAVYFIFEDLASTKKFIADLSAKIDTYEYTIYNSNYEFVDFI